MERVCSYMGGITRDLNGKVMASGGAADHVHLVATIHPSMAVADFVKEVKTGSCKLARRQIHGLSDFWWQEGYAAFTVSKSAAASVIRYVNERGAHHKKMSFQEEFLALLKWHGVEYDERYIWR